MYRLLTILLLPFIISCISEKEKPSFSNLRIVVVENSDYFLDSVVFSNSKTGDSLRAWYQEDSFANVPHYVHDSVPNGPVTINFISRFHRIHKMQLQLEHDSTVRIEPEGLTMPERMESSNIMTEDIAEEKEILIQADFPSFVGESKHEIHIKKEGTDYKLVFNSKSETMQGITKRPQVERVLDASFIKTFLKFQEECNKLSAKSSFSRCDHGGTFYIVSGDKLFTCHDPCVGWKGYDDFLKALNLTSN